MNGPVGTSIGHAELKIGDSVFMLADEFPQMKCLSPESIGGSTVSIYLYVSDVDASFNKAISEGASVIEPVTDKFYGDRSGLLKDPFGHYWSIATHKKDVSPEEMKKGADAVFAEMAKKAKSK
jgi:PhnB protein